MVLLAPPAVCMCVCECMVVVVWLQFPTALLLTPLKGLTSKQNSGTQG